MSKQKDKLGWGKYRTLLWLLVVSCAAGLFSLGFDPVAKGDNEDWSWYYPDTHRTSIDFKGQHNENKFLFVYSRKNLVDEANAKAEVDYATRRHNLYARYNIKEKIKGIAYRSDKHGQAIAISLFFPIVLILLTILFEKPIVRKLEKINS